MTESVRAGRAAKGLGWLARRAVVVAAAALVVAFPVATWWLAGDQSTIVGADADYAFEPFAVTASTERAAGVGSAFICVAALSMLLWATRRHRLDARWWLALIPLVTAGFMVGFGWRVMTAGVIGANIGAGLVVLLGGPVVAALLIGATAYAVRLAHRGRIAGTTPPTYGRG